MSNPKKLLLACAIACALANAAVADEKAEASDSELDTIKVIGITPQQGAELPESAIPYNVQTTTAGALDRSQTFNITDYMNRNLTGVTINSAQSNPLQPNLQFRGFTASPLLGGSEGISVYVDGVRVNEVFGDSVNWDLIPEEIISSMSVISGANPVYGLNTLGGAINITTRNGFTDPGMHIESTYGSWGRNESSIQGGGNNGTWGWYGVADHFEERGWRDYSASNANNVLANGSYRSDDATLDLHLAHAESKLNGNGASPLGEIAERPQAVFTAPDRTENYYDLINLQGTYKFTPDSILSATLFGRQVNTRSYNGDASDFNACDDNGDFLCDDDGAPVLDQNGNRVSFEYNAINNIGVRKQRSWGGSLQWVFRQPLFGRTNQFAAGLDYDHGRVNYTSLVEASTLIVVDSRPLSSITQDDTGIVIPDEALDVHATSLNEGLYATDTLNVTDKLALTASARYNRTHAQTADLSGDSPDLNGDHRYSRLNPAVGLAYQLSSSLNVYGGYSESTRAPTAVELACASPDAPCKLPNEFVADPDLKQVVAKNWEAGLRGTFDGGLFGATRWKAGLFRTTNDNDIIFQSTGGAQSNEGYFANVGQTRRQGAEASISGKALDNRLDWFANYTYLDATFRTPFEEISANHPDADPETRLLQVDKGDRLPGLPRQAFKVGADFAVTPQLTVGGDMMVNSSQYYRGDEANLLPPLGGFAVVNLRAVYRVIPHVSLFARVQNLFDRGYSDFGVIGNASDVLPQFTDPRLVSPGAPRAEWIGVSIDF